MPSLGKDVSVDVWSSRLVVRSKRWRSFNQPDCFARQRRRAHWSFRTGTDQYGMEPV